MDPNLIRFLDISVSPLGFIGLSIALIGIAWFRPFIAIAMLCFFSTLPFSASIKVVITWYPFYLVSLFLLFKYRENIMAALQGLKYDKTAILSMFIVSWSVLSPFLYPVRDGMPYTTSNGPTFFRGLETIVLLILLPAVIRNRNDMHKMLRSLCQVIIGLHFALIPLITLFVLRGNGIGNIYRMEVLDVPPVYWESGLLILCAMYLSAGKSMKQTTLIVLVMLACAGIVLGNSRTKVFSTLLCLLYFGYPYINVKVVSIGTVVLTLFTAGIFFTPGAFTQSLKERVESRIEQMMSPDKDEMTSGRTSLFRYAIDAWKESPVLGVGGCYVTKPEMNLNHIFDRQRPHNYFLEVLGGQGLVGFFLLMLVLGITVRRIWRITRNPISKINDGRLIMALLIYNLLNWLSKESWGMVYPLIIMLGIYDRVGLANAPAAVYVRKKIHGYIPHRQRFFEKANIQVSK